MLKGNILLKKLLYRSSRSLPFLCLLIIVFTIGYILGGIQSTGLGLYVEKHETAANKYSTEVVKTIATTSLVVIIFSSPKYIEKRNTIRKTWLLTKEKKNILHFFVIGTASLQSHEITSLQSENKIHHDLILLPNVVDSYTLLSLKLLEGFRWITEHIMYTFLLKVDDDSFVRLDKLYDLAMNKPQERLYWGFFDGKANVKRLGKWAEKNWTLCDHYLPYAKGGGYVLTSDLVKYVVGNSNLLSMFKNEDVSVGAWLAPLAIIRFHDLRFDTEFRSRGCDNSFIVTHKQSVSLMKEKYENLLVTGNLCSSEFRTMLAYVYNWNVPPSKCCTRNVSTFISD